jgi:chemotaxis regulatin CheY-phosphate phosphatase CheZ
VLPLPQAKKNFLVMVKEDASEATIAHEIAHAYLKHLAYTDISAEQAEEFEKDAKVLSSKWQKMLRELPIQFHVQLRASI